LYYAKKYVYSRSATVVKFKISIIILCLVVFIGACGKHKDTPVPLDPPFLTQFGAVTKDATTDGGGDNSLIDQCLGVAVDSSGNVYCAGYTSGSMGEPHGGGINDAFVMKLNSSGTLQWITHLGNITKDSAAVITPYVDASNNGLDKCNGIAVDDDYVYCAGHTASAMGELPATVSDAFVMKLDASDGALVWLTHLGADLTNDGLELVDANGNDVCYGVAVDSSGNVYCAGFTNGNLGEVNGGGLADAFVMKLNSGGTLEWLTHLGDTTTDKDSVSTPYTLASNSASDQCFGVAVDNSDGVYCAGFTKGDMGEVNAHANGSDPDAFVMKLDANNGSLQWLTQLGTITKDATTNGGDNSKWDECRGVAVDNSDGVYCAGHTKSAMGETLGGETDAFVMKLATSDGSFQWLTHLGDTTKASGGNNAGLDKCYGVAVDGSGYVYCAGQTISDMGETHASSIDAFVMKLDASNGSLQWLTQLGAITTGAGGNNSKNDYCYGVAADSSGNVYCAGTTQSDMGEAADSSGQSDAFVLKLNSNGKLN
jgi:hypothetical protein